MKRNNLNIIDAPIKGEAILGPSFSVGNDPDTRVFYLTDDIDIASVQSIIQQIHAINEQDRFDVMSYAFDGHVYNPKPIKLYISSYGGNVYDGFALIGAIQTSKTPVHCIATGKVMSMGFLITLAGHKRFATPFTTFMYHSVSSFSWGQVGKLEEDVDETRRLQTVIEDYTVERTKFTRKQLKKICDRKKDYYFDVTTAIQYDVVSSIV